MIAEAIRLPNWWARSLISAADMFCGAKNVADPGEFPLIVTVPSGAVTDMGQDMATFTLRAVPGPFHLAEA